MECNRCGQCCTYSVFITDVKVADDPEEMGRWYRYHHLKVMSVPRPGGDVLGVRVPLPCEHLEFDTATATAFCMIYATRPQICRDHICEAMEKT